MFQKPPFVEQAAVGVEAKFQFLGKLRNSVVSHANLFWRIRLSLTFAIGQTSFEGSRSRPWVDQGWGRRTLERYWRSKSPWHSNQAQCSNNESRSKVF